MGLEDTLYSRWDSDFAPCLGVSKPGSRAGDYSCEDSVQARVPWSECTPDLVMQISKTAGWNYYLGIGDMSLSISMC